MADATDNRLRLLVERIERIEEEIHGLREDRKDVFGEAKALGYDTGIIRAVIARRRIDPAARDAGDALLQTYEAAIGGMADDPAVPPDQANRLLAEAILAEQLAGIGDDRQAANLVDHVRVILDIRAEIALLREQERNRLKLAKAEGWLSKQISATVRWIEKCAKHGPDSMTAAERVFHLYRGTVDERGLAASSPTDDPALQKITKPGAADPKMDKAAAWIGLGSFE